MGRSKAELDSGILPRPVSLVGGVDKPHKRDEDEIEDSDDNGDGTNQNQHHQHQHKRRKHKNQQCPYCFKFFTQSTHLEVHIRSHIGYKPFECTYCHKKFTQEVIYVLIYDYILERNHLLVKYVNDHSIEKVILLLIN